VGDTTPWNASDRFLSRRRVLQGLAMGAGLSVVGGVPSAWARQGAARQSAALRPPGTRPYPKKPEGVDTMPQIEHVVIYMQENHSFDNYFGMLGRGDGLRIGKDGKPTNTNPGLDGKPVPMFHMDATCDTTNGASQSWDGSHISWNNGKMDGFVRAANGGTGSMGYWDGTDLPFYYGLAKQFVLCDRWFCSTLAQTFPNRRYLQAATSVGIVSTDLKEVLATPDAPNGVIWERLDAHGISWADYTIDLPDIFLFPNFAAKNQDKIKKFHQFLIDCAKGALPQVSIISPGGTTYTEEDPADIQNGEAYSSAIIHALMQSPAWEKTVLFFMYDEHGGYYDHVPPPAAPAPDDIKPRITVPPDEPGGFDRYGMRVPALVISPFAKRDYVSHVVHDHTSVLKFIETKFNLGAMTYRDANADDLLDTLDFDNPGFREPPDLPKPALPASGSVCQALPLPEQPAPTTTTSTIAAPASKSNPASGTGGHSGSGGSSPIAPLVAVGAVTAAAAAGVVVISNRRKSATKDDAATDRPDQGD
jgi:phospholipase C